MLRIDANRHKITKQLLGFLKCRNSKGFSLLWAVDGRRNGKKETAFRLSLLVGEAGLEGVLCKPACRLFPWSSVVRIPQKSTTRRPSSCQLTSQTLLSPNGLSDGDTIINHCSDFLCRFFRRSLQTVAINIEDSSFCHS